MTRKNIIWAAIIVVIIGLLIFFGTTHKNENKENETGPIKIGFIGPLTGDAANIGQQSQAAVQIATDEINKAGGINGRQVNVVYEDGKCGAEAASAAQKLMNVDKVNAIIGGACSGETSSFIKTAMQNKIPVISYCSSNPSLTGAGKYFFRNYPSDTFQGKFAADYLYNTLGVRKVAVLYVVNDWASGIKPVFDKEFKKLGGEIVYEEGVSVDASDYKTQIQKIKLANPDYIYSLSYEANTAILVNQMKNLGVNIKLFGGDAWSDPKLFKETSGKADMLFATPKTPDNKDFDSKILAKTGSAQVGTCTAEAYDAMNLVAKTISTSGLDADSFANALRAVVYDGISGKIAFDENGDMTSAMYVVKRITNGTATEVK